MHFIIQRNRMDEHVRSMVYRTLILLLFVQFISTASIRYDPYLKVPEKQLNCGELRKQFADGYIVLKDFLDRIRKCKESPEHLHNHNEHDSTEKTEQDDTKKSATYDPSQYTYTDYLVPVLKTTLPDPTAVAVGKTIVLSPMQDTSGASPIFLTKLVTKPGISSSVSQSKTPLSSLVNTNADQRYAIQPSYVPTLNSFTAKTTGSKSRSWSEYFQYRNLLQGLGYDKNMFAQNQNVLPNVGPAANLPPVLPLIPFVPNAQPMINNIPQATSNLVPIAPMISNLQPMISVNPPLAALINPPPASLINPPTNFINPSSSIINPAPGLINPSQGIINPALGLINAPSDMINSQAVSTQFQQNLSPNKSELGQSGVTLNSIQNLPQVSVASVDGPTTSTAEELSKINAELKDDVSLLNSNQGGHTLTLTDFDSFAPQIIENIAARSSINKMEDSKQTNNNKTEPDDEETVSTKSTLNNFNSAKDILDIKYSQLEDKLMTDIKRRQAILQKLEQESISKHYTKPDPIPVEKLGDIFQRISEDMIVRSFGGKNETSQGEANKKEPLIKMTIPEDNLGLLEGEEHGPTAKRTLVDKIGYQNSILSSLHQKQKQRRRKSFKRRHGTKPTPSFLEKEFSDPLSIYSSSSNPFSFDSPTEETDSNDIPGFIRLPIRVGNVVNMEPTQSSHNDMTEQSVQNALTNIYETSVLKDKLTEGAKLNDVKNTKSSELDSDNYIEISKYTENVDPKQTKHTLNNDLKHEESSKKDVQVHAHSEEDKYTASHRQDNKSITSSIENDKSTENHVKDKDTSVHVTDNKNTSSDVENNKEEKNNKMSESINEESKHSDEKYIGSGDGVDEKHDKEADLISKHKNKHNVKHTTTHDQKKNSVSKDNNEHTSSGDHENEKSVDSFEEELNAFSRENLFTNKKFNSVLTEAMSNKKSSSNNDDDDDDKDVHQKKSDITKISKEPKRRKFSIAKLQYGLLNGNNVK